MNKVRVRFAPSPTGPLHIGGVRTALFNYLFAKKHGGDFLLRIEDTDQTRFVKNAENYIVESLEWCGIKIDEGVGAGGEYGPYRQSERKNLYRNFAFDLIASGHAYYAFDTSEELTALREKGEQEKKPFVYSYETRGQLNNSLTLSKEEVAEKIANKTPYVIRFKMPENEELHLFDEIRKDVRFNTKELDDKVLFKADGMPTYHLANVVDDYSMGITHVIRGEEWLPSMPLHVLLYRAFGWEDEMPKFAHLPLILKPVGKGKLSKRDGEKMGFPVFPLKWIGDNGEEASGYREDGYFSEAFVNMLALLGWNPGTEQEIFTMDELIEAFSLERVGKSGSKFDPDKTKWFNQQWLQRKSVQDLTVEFEKVLAHKGVTVTTEYATKVVEMVKERAGFVSEIWDHGFYFFQSPAEYDKKVAKKRWKGDAPQAIEDIKEMLKEVSEFVSTGLEESVKAYIQEKELNLGQIMNCLRLCIVGSGMGANLFDIFEMIGKEETISRLEKGIQTLNK